MWGTLSTDMTFSTLSFSALSPPLLLLIVRADVAA